LADFHKSLSLSPDDRDVLKDTAEVYQHQKRPQRTLSTLAHLSETYGSGNVPSSILTMEGRAHEALGRRQEALLCYRRAIATGEDSKEAVEHLAALEGGKPIAKVATAPQGNSTTLRP
jgi:tetratricopeptide (TPR) repeat protein